MNILMGVLLIIYNGFDTTDYDLDTTHFALVTAHHDFDTTHYGLATSTIACGHDRENMLLGSR